MAILGYFFTRFPVFFESALTVLKTRAKIFTDNADVLRIYILLFGLHPGIKRGTRLIQKAHDVFFVLPLPAGLKR
ncbi:hypothetical protein [Citrobacter amalonaticus]|uniref:hypothetical protein n=1 Tax=Citrobacter amalonaticus TaxID=35703 RepID=UPI00300C6E80